MWIGDEVIIGGGDSIYDYDMATWNEKVYASVRVDVNGDFVDKNISNEYIPATDIASFKRLVNNNFQDTVVVDTDGTVYLSGSNEDVNYNYVWYSGKLWRITAINPDGTMKLITENNITTIAYGIDDSKFYVNDNEKSYVYQWLNEDFLDTLYNYENIINVNSSWNVTPNNSSTNATSCPEYDTVISISPPKNSSEGAVIVKSNVGLLNSYEYYKTYENFGIYNYSNSYLNDGYDWWLVNQLVTLGNRESIWIVNKEGRVASSLTTMNEGVRPVINLKSNDSTNILVIKDMDKINVDRQEILLEILEDNQISTEKLPENLKIILNSELYCDINYKIRDIVELYKI